MGGTPEFLTPTLVASLGRSEGVRGDALVSLVKLHWFIRHRWAAFGAAVVLLVIERWIGGPPGRPLALLVVVGALGAVNLLWSALSRLLFAHVVEETPDGQRALLLATWFANAQVLVDIILLTALLRYVGGVQSPLAVFYVFHMVIAALLLQRWHAIGQGVCVLVLYAALGIGEYAGWLRPHYDLFPQAGDAPLYAQAGYISMKVAAIVCGVAGTLYFTLHIVSLLDFREKQLWAANLDLQRSQQRVQDLQTRRSRFMQTAAHQLKSPLAAIQTLAGLIRDQLVEGEALRATCDRIYRRCREGIEDVGELLTLARLQDTEPQELSQTPCKLREVAEQVRRRFSLIAAGNGVTIATEFAPATPEDFWVGAADLADCLNNLVENAVKYTPDGGAILIAVAAPAYDAQLGTEALCIEVVDNGIGLDVAEAMRHDGADGGIFDAFRRGNNALAAGIPGNGLGLSIVRAVVERFGGRLRLRSAPNRGTRVAVYFPTRPQTPDGSTLPLADCIEVAPLGAAEARQESSYA